MGNAIEVADALSNAEEHIERAAKAIGKSKPRRAVFEAIYYHKARVKTVPEILKRLRVMGFSLTPMRVLQEGRHLERHGIVRDATEGGRKGYRMVETFHVNKARILKYVDNPKKLATLATKRRPSVAVNVQMKAGQTGRARARLVTIDDFDSFRRVRKVKSKGLISRSVSETHFKRGIQNILREPGEWKDWGGELHDLASTRLVYKGRRVGVVFAFKGPAKKGPLVPGMMGKNGDQIPRMFFGDGQVFLVQYHETIKPSVLHDLKINALNKSLATGDVILYGIIDGVDSERLLRAYPAEFAKGGLKK